MKKAARLGALSVALGLLVSASVTAGTPSALLHLGGQPAGVETGISARVGPPSVEQQPNPAPIPICPGYRSTWSISFVGTAFGTINAGDSVKGTLTVSGFVFVTCQVNAPTLGTCTVAPDGSSASFDLTNVQSPSGGDIGGGLELPLTAPPCGEIVIGLNLTEPHAFQVQESENYSCNGAQCVIPTLGRTGLAIMALLLAAAAVAVLLRRSLT